MAMLNNQRVPFYLFGGCQYHSPKAVAGDEITFQVQLRDAYGNILPERLS